MIELLIRHFDENKRKEKTQREIPIGNVAPEHCYYFCKETCTCTNLACFVDGNLWYVKYYLLLLLLLYYYIIYYCYYNYFYHHYYIKIKTIKSCLEIFKQREYRYIWRILFIAFFFIFFLLIFILTYTYTSSNDVILVIYSDNILQKRNNIYWNDFMSTCLLQCHFKNETQFNVSPKL